STATPRSRVRRSLPSRRCAPAWKRTTRRGGRSPPTPTRSRRWGTGSGGAEEHRGGDGIVRSVRVLEPASPSLLTDRRRHGPGGAEGGESGRPGRNLLNGEELPAKTSRDLEEGDVVTVETPGGGGYGRA
ncbi:MAG TPA: hydantoinase B/oxoprolinase family protein, partial [Rubrobacter sp.]|nr:hydantoinase B/oxoprolinase family protein [Rubrobacter sp.]